MSQSSTLKVNDIQDLSGNSLIGGSTPAGTVFFYTSSSTPSGYLTCNGASVSTSTYASLFSAIGYTYGGSGGSFNVPDLRGEFIRGWDDGRGVDSGRAIGSFQDHNFASHRHTFNAGSSENGGGRDCGCYPRTDCSDLRGNVRSDSLANSGGNETRPRNYALHAIIKY